MRPAAVVMRASEMPAETVSFDTPPTAMPAKALIMPVTVPSIPSSGAEPATNESTPSRLLSAEEATCE